MSCTWSFRGALYIVIRNGVAFSNVLSIAMHVGDALDEDNDGQARYRLQ